MKLQLLATLALITISNSAWASNYRCVGTEPFFNIVIDPSSKKLRYSTPTNVDGTVYAITKSLQADGLQTGNVFMFKGTKSNVSATLTHSNIAGNACSDGMSDTAYTYHLVFNRNLSVQYGCCNRID